MHNKYLFTNVIGTFVFNEHFSLLDKKLFDNNEQYLKSSNVEKEFAKKYTNLKKPEGRELQKILEFFNNPSYFEGFYEGNLAAAKKDIRDSVKEDLLIMQAVSHIGEIEKAVNTFTKRLREWYAWYNPEMENYLKDQEKFVELVILGKEKKVNDSMGSEFSKEDLEPIISIGKEIKSLSGLRVRQEKYLEKLMNKVIPNVLAITGALIGAKLLEQAGGLKNLMLFPASTIQLLGAEKALFRHMKSNSKAPKYGFLFQHPLISKNPKERHGKIARALADKISIAVKIDYFHGKFIGDKLLKEIEDKFKD